MSETDKPVDTTVDPAEKTRGVDADTEQSSDERGEAIREFDDHMDSSGDKPSLPTPGSDQFGESKTDPKTTQRSE